MQDHRFALLRPPPHQVDLQLVHSLSQGWAAEVIINADAFLVILNRLSRVFVPAFYMQLVPAVERSPGRVPWESLVVDAHLKLVVLGKVVEFERDSAWAKKP